MNKSNNFKKIQYKGHICNHDHHESHCSCGHNHHLPYTFEQVEITGDNVFSFYIKGLDCANCAQKVEKTIKKLDIIEDVNLNFATEILKVKTKKEIKEEKLIKILQETINKIEQGVILSFKNNSNSNFKLFNIKENFMLIIGIIFYIFSIFMQNNEYSIILFIASYLLIGHKILIKATKNIFKGQLFDENFLMCLATIGAFIINNYTEAVAVLLFYSIGEIFQTYAVNKSRKSISDLMDLKNEIAHIKKDNKIMDIDPENININDIVVVKIGEKVPVDGIIYKGNSTLNMSSLTGETLPVEIKENEKILSGSINLTNILEIKATKKYKDSTVSQILNLIENSSMQKAPIENFITKFAKRYTPIVCFLALIIAFIPPLLNPSAIFTDYLYKAFTFLVISCPCALVISIPLALYAGIGQASKKGILIKGGNYLEELKNIDTFIFDKTGTLTEGKFKVTKIDGPDNLLEIIAHGEFYSNHPIAKSIQDKYNQPVNEKRISNFKEIQGKGIEVCVDDNKYLLGNRKLFDEKNIAINYSSDIGTIIYVAQNNKYIGRVVISDELKNNTKTGINSLISKHNKNIAMLTGDSEIVAKNVADKLAIKQYFSNLLPHQKISKVQEFKSNQKVAFVGDGINDAPVLAFSNIGIAMGGIGSDAAIEAADIIIMNDDISLISKAVDISNKTNKILKQNIIFILSIKILVLTLTVLGLSNMWMGIFADVGLALLSIFNSMRAIK